MIIWFCKLIIRLDLGTGERKTIKSYWTSRWDGTQQWYLDVIIVLEMKSLQEISMRIHCLIGDITRDLKKDLINIYSKLSAAFFIAIMKYNQIEHYLEYISIAIRKRRANWFQMNKYSLNYFNILVCVSLDLFTTSNNSKAHRNIKDLKAFLISTWTTLSPFWLHKWIFMNIPEARPINYSNEISPTRCKQFINS